MSDSGTRNRERTGAKKIWEILLVLLPPFNSAILEPNFDLFVLKKKRDSCKIIGTNDHFAQCKVIRIPELQEFLLLEPGIRGFGIVEFSLRNPESRLGSDSGIHSPQFPSRFYSANRNGIILVPRAFPPFSEGSPEDKVRPEFLKTSPTANLSFRQIQSFCQLLSLCAHYILLLFKQRFQSTQLFTCENSSLLSLFLDARKGSALQIS